MAKDRPKGYKNCKFEKDPKGNCREVCDDENGKPVWRDAPADQCKT